MSEVIVDCWNEIGVWADEPSCERLEVVNHCHNCPVFSTAGRSLLEREPQPEYLEEWTRALLRDKDHTRDDLVSVFIFRIGAEWLGLPASAIHEVAEVRPIRKIPHRSNAILRGLVNMHGELQLCVSLADLLGIDAAQIDAPADRLIYRRMATLRDEAQRWVFDVDEVWGTHRFASGEMQALPDTVSRDRKSFSKGMFEWSYGAVALLDPALLFAALQRRVHG